METNLALTISRADIAAAFGGVRRANAWVVASAVKALTQNPQGSTMLRQLADALEARIAELAESGEVTLLTCGGCHLAFQPSSVAHWDDQSGCPACGWHPELEGVPTDDDDDTVVLRGTNAARRAKGTS